MSDEQSVSVVRESFRAIRDPERQRDLIADEYIRHEPEGTRAVSSDRFLAQIAAIEAPELRIEQLDIFGEGDFAAAIWTATGPTGPQSSVSAYRVVAGRIAETWYSSVVSDRWSWDPEIDASVTRTQSTELMHRWYDEVYGEGRVELIPELAGPVYRRHEFTGSGGPAAEFSMSGDEYRERLAEVIPRGGSKFDYRTIAGDDKVAVIGANWVQAWRVSDGKFVESWWPGFATGAW